MNCLKCGKENVENALFCSCCGSRLDSKKKCSYCGEFVDVDALFCNNCGNRLDGKSVCSKCGFAFEGEFCPQCGSSKASNNNFKNKKIAQNSTFSKIESIVSPCLTLGAILMLFIASFFVGVRINSSFNMEIAGVSYSPFYFFGEVYQNLAMEFNGIENVNLSFIKSGIYAPIIFCTVVIALNMLTSFVFLIIASIKTGVGLHKKEEVNLTPFLAVSFATFMLTIITMLSFFGTDEMQITSILTTKVTLNSFSGITFGVVLAVILAVMVLKLIKNFNVNQLIHSSIALISVILLVVVLFVLSGACIGVKFVYKQNGIIEEILINWTPFGLMSSASYLMLALSDSIVLFYNTIVNPSYVIYVWYVVTVIFACVCLAMAVCSTINYKKVLSLIFSAILSGFSFVYMIVSIVLVNKTEFKAFVNEIICRLVDGNVYMSSLQPIIAFVCSLIVLGITIAGCAIKKQKKEF